ncbi:MAG: DUF6509 family protein [Bacillus sp. (in: Bacteria)]|nr:DUF6509 family protein [Bacillus sp. (in: firmicutes)]
MNITGHSVEKLTDPFGLLTGKRYEFFLDLEVDDEDELYSDDGVGLRIIFVSDELGQRISQYHFFVRTTEKIIDFALEEDEEESVLTYCKENLIE